MTGNLSPDSGRLLVDGRDVTDLPTHRRNMGMVFQSFALFPHLSVTDNIGFALEARGVPTAERTTRVAEALAMVHLDAYPRHLSGGQQQRVGLVRAIIYRPTILLLDEPLSNLDASLREEMRLEISEVTRRLGITSIYVTHDQREALALWDDRGHGSRPDRAGGHAGGHLSPPRQHLRRLCQRAAGDDKGWHRDDRRRYRTAGDRNASWARRAANARAKEPGQWTR